MRVLVTAQLVQRGEVLVTLVTAVRHLTLVRLGVLEKGLQLSEGMAALLHHTLVHLKGGQEADGIRTAAFFKESLHTKKGGIYILYKSWL